MHFIVLLDYEHFVCEKEKDAFVEILEEELDKFWILNM